MPEVLRRVVRRLLGLEELVRLHALLPRDLTPAQFCDAALARLSIEVSLTSGSLEQVPRSGPVVFVCNHPQGALDGLVTISQLGAVRTDLRVLANFELAAIPQLAGIILPLDPYGSPQAAVRNAMSLRRALEWLRAGGRRVSLAIGAPSPPSQFDRASSDEEIVARLRLRLELLRDQPVARAQGRSVMQPTAPVVAGGVSQRLAAQDRLDEHRAEIAALPPEALLVQSGHLEVYRATAAQIPRLLLEIGRLRERTFRAVGEGTGQELDLDLFDNYYGQLFLWDESLAQVVGGYRLGRVDEIRRRYGVRGLYTHTLFDYQEPLLRLLGPTLELGRSFVREEWQRSYAPLPMLWRGIGEIVARDPRYRRLLGPVSISQSYGNWSRDLMVAWLRMTYFEPWLAALVRPRNRYRRSHALRSLGSCRAALGDIEAVSGLIAQLEPDHKGVRVLLRHYPRLGGRILGFNVDPAFANAIDCLLLLDLRDTERAPLRKYLTAEGLRRFEAQHATRTRRSARGTQPGTITDRHEVTEELNGAGRHRSVMTRTS